MTQANNNTESRTETTRTELTLAEQVAQMIEARGLSSRARPSKITNQRTTSLERGGHRGLGRTTLRGSSERSFFG